MQNITLAQHMSESIGQSLLARAAKWLSEHRVLLSGHKTVIFK
ncbi:MAG: hypothetical protein Q8R72_06790 [Hylemonella sp.]|nr:hypothetical protein [Hylemonella sp.]